MNTESKNVNSVEEFINSVVTDDLINSQEYLTFPKSATTAEPLFFRSYSRKLPNGNRENWYQSTLRVAEYLREVGKLTNEEFELIFTQQLNCKSLFSGRLNWVGGTEWIKKPENFYGSYNCMSTNVYDIESFGLLMNLAMQGTGTGAVLEPVYIEQLPEIRNTLNIQVVDKIGDVPKEQRIEKTKTYIVASKDVFLYVGDSRQGWVESYTKLLYLATDPGLDRNLDVKVFVGNVRPKGEDLKGFGGVANPNKLPELYNKVANILNKAVGRQLTAVECCLVIDEAMVCVVAGNIRRSAGMKQFNSADTEAATAKDNLWQQDENGQWRIDPERDALRMSNHTRVFHQKPTLEEITAAVTKQYYSGEGAIQFAPEAIARANADLLTTDESRKEFIAQYCISEAHGLAYLEAQARYQGHYIDVKEAEHRLSRYATNPCFAPGTIILTREGHFPIESLIGKVVDVWDGDQWVTIDNFRVTGENQKVYTIELNSGQIVTATEYHTFVLANGERKKLFELSPGDLLAYHDVEIHGLHHEPSAYLKGFLVGDGTTRNENDPALKLYPPKYICEERLINSLAEIDVLQLVSVGGKKTAIAKAGFSDSYWMQGLTARKTEFIDWVTINRKTFPLDMLNWDLPSKLDFIAGVMDADGTASDTKNGWLYQICSIHKQWLEGFQLLLRSIGVKSKLALAKKGGVKDFKNRGGECFTQPLYRLTISQESSIILAQKVNFTRLTSFARKQTTYKLKPKETKIVSINFSHIAEKVYCCTVPTNHKLSLSNGLITGQCGEIIGTTFFCNLGEVHLNQLDPFNLDEQRQAFKAAAIAVCTLLHHKFVDERYAYSRELDPIVGVSFTGLFDFFVNAFGVDWLKWWKAGRPDEWKEFNGATWNSAEYFKKQEKWYLEFWKQTVKEEVTAYCVKHGLKVPNRYTTVQPAGCLDKTAIRVFDQGLMYLDELVNPGSGDSYGLDLSVRNGVSADKAIANQPMNLVKVTLKNGRILKMTPNHRLSVEGTWVRADEMKPGMLIDFSLGQYSKTENALLLPINPEHYTRDYRRSTVGHGRGLLTQEIVAPTQVDEDLAYFLGCLFGNGHISQSPKRVRFSFGSTMTSTVQKLQNIGKKLFGFEGVITDEGTKLELCFSSGQLVDWLENNNLGKKERSAKLDRIPLAIRQSSLEVILSFFCGLIDTDGCVRKEGSLSIDSASEFFLRNLQQIGEAVGLSFSVFHNTEGENKQGQKDMWGLCLSRMVSTEYALNYLNRNSIKCQNRNLPKPKRYFKFNPYEVVNIEFETTPDYSFDISVDGVDDDDSWYWQGALKSHNSKSLLTGASPGFHVPKASVYIRRMTFDRDNPIALACMDYGYNVIPGQSDKDENGNLLNDPFDPRCTEWLVEIPFKCGWADIPGATDIDISKFSVAAQYDFYMQVQRFYTTHNTSATLELRENEIPVLSELIHNSIQNDEGYISAALLARFDSLETFPRLPFEPITLETYNKLYQDVLDRRKSDNFIALLAQYDQKAVEAFNQGAAGCDSDKCLMPEIKPTNNGKIHFEPVQNITEKVQNGSIIAEHLEQVE